MKKLILLLTILAFYGCNKPKSVFICGDHVCVNKAEAEQYFEDNLTLEVRVIDKKKSKEINLVQINLESNTEGKKEISIFNKKKTNEKLKELTDLEIKEKKIALKKKKKIKKRKVKNKKLTKDAKLKNNKVNQKPLKKVEKTKEIVKKPTKKIRDICTILEKCSIDEISKYLVKQGEEKKFPDITIREDR